MMNEVDSCGNQEVHVESAHILAGHLAKTESHGLVASAGGKADPASKGDPSKMDEINEQITATNSTHQPHMTAISTSPANLSVQRKRQRSEAFMLDMNRDGYANILNKESISTSKYMLPQKSPHRFNRTTRLVSTRRTDPKARSIMPKTAINYYNLRKGLYLKNGGTRGLSLSRAASKLMGSHD